MVGYFDIKVGVSRGTRGVGCCKGVDEDIGYKEVVGFREEEMGMVGRVAFGSFLGKYIAGVVYVL